MAVKNRWLALVGLTISVLVIGFDTTILNVALPTLAAETGASAGELQWIIDSYAVVYAAAMLPAGLLGDRFGRRKLLITGLVIFLGGSVMGTFVDTPGALIGARTIMGLGAALIMPLTLSLIPTLFKGEEQTKAIAIVTVGVSIGLPLGPLISGWLLDHFWWGSVFVINIPLVAVGILAAVLLIPETKDPTAPRIDIISAVLGILGLGALVYGVIEAPAEGWGDPVILATMTGGALMLVGLVLREKRQPRPMVDLELLRNPTFGWNTLFLILGMFVFMGLLFVLPQYLQVIQGNDAFGTGLRLMPLMAGMIVVARIVPPLSVRFGTRPLVVTGLLIMSTAMFIGSATDENTGYGYAVVWMVLVGLGTSMVMVPALDTALGVLPKGKEGTGSSLSTTLRQVGGAVGIALLGSVLNAVFTNEIDTGGVPAQAAETAEESVVAAQAVAAQLDMPQLAQSAESAFVSGMSAVLLICGIAGVVAAVLAVLKLPDSRENRTAEDKPADTEDVTLDKTDTKPGAETGAGGEEKAGQPLTEALSDAADGAGK
ncbi:MFS transporter [Streptomyces sp. WMMC500]|uniref:MFS transporter n=1 Tax=Streptomyces sp. WMMC500 TaxID=3015154 RepID=UPI00248C69B8|nr:MFS transporter [Streptomyces sp. WMMC500]WBB61022.1 MFS transporter [Streptomyces sp. WMMC500]